jgi:hypothetical protein
VYPQVGLVSRKPARKIRGAGVYAFLGNSATAQGSINPKEMQIT